MLFKKDVTLQLNFMCDCDINIEAAEMQLCELFICVTTYAWIFLLVWCRSIRVHMHVSVFLGRWKLAFTWWWSLQEFELCERSRWSSTEGRKHTSLQYWMCCGKNYVCLFKQNHPALAGCKYMYVCMYVCMNMHWISPKKRQVLLQWKLGPKIKVYSK
jgi:hypothetical protein